MSDMPKIRIDSDGTTANTNVYINGIPLANLQSVKFEAKHNKDLVTITTTTVYPDMVEIKDEPV